MDNHNKISLMVAQLPRFKGSTFTIAELNEDISANLVSQGIYTTKEGCNKGMGHIFRKYVLPGMSGLKLIKSMPGDGCLRYKYCW